MLVEQEAAPKLKIPCTYTAIDEAVLQLLDPASLHGIPAILESEELIDETSIKLLYISFQKKKEHKPQDPQE
ncbi:hypothetical protein Hamer_G007628, partial [Homarus americanus]